MRKQTLLLGLIASIATLMMLGCGGGMTTSSFQQSTSSPSLNTGSVAIIGGDEPVCDVLSFDVTITGATLTPQGGGAPVSVISSTSPVKIDFAALMDFTALLNLASVPVGTYTKITLTLASPQLTILDTTASPPAPKTIIPTTLTTSTVTVDVTPPLTVVLNATVGLGLDFNLRKSVKTDNQGQVTGTVDPVFRAGPTRSDENGIGDVDELEGIVQSVSTTSTNPAFIGSFVLRPQVGADLTVNITSKTLFKEEGITGLTGLTKGTFVEVNAFLDHDHNVIAKEVEVEPNEEAEQKKGAFLGRILSVTRDSKGKATQFKLFVRQEHPDDVSATVPKHSTLVVNVSTSTKFKITAEGTNRASLKFDPTTLGEGQEVVVHGQIQLGPPPSLNAEAVFLRMQSIVGNFTSLIIAGSDGKTGGFIFTPCGGVFLGRPITVVTSHETAFAGVADLKGLTAKPTLIVKGVLLFEQTITSVGTVSVKPPTWVFEAQQVHQLND